DGDDWEGGLRGCARRLRHRQILRPVFGSNPGERNKDISHGIYTGRAADAVLPKPRIRLRAGVYRADPDIGSLQWCARSQGAAGALAADDAWPQRRGTIAAHP